MGGQTIALDEEDDELQELVRILGASVNVNILRVLARARRVAPADGWLFLSEIAEAIHEKPGTIGIAIQKMIPRLVEERREKGRRYFRSNVTELRVELDSPSD